MGEGVSGIVRLVKHKATGVQYACKILDIGLIQTDDGLRQLRDEISIMCQLDHPNIVRIEVSRLLNDYCGTFGGVN